MKATILSKAINRNKPFPSSGVLPLTLLNLGCTRHSSSQLDTALICTRFQAAFMVCYLYPRALPPVTQSSAFQAPERLRIQVM